jgi:hypothetical protein
MLLMLKDVFKVDSRLNHDTSVLMVELWSQLKQDLSGMRNEAVLSVPFPVAHTTRHIMPFIQILLR